jgi:hypothetical protein
VCVCVWCVEGLEAERSGSGTEGENAAPTAVGVRLEPRFVGVLPSDLQTPPAPNKANIWELAWHPLAPHHQLAASFTVWPVGAALCSSGDSGVNQSLGRGWLRRVELCFGRSQDGLVAVWELGWLTTHNGGTATQKVRPSPTPQSMRAPLHRHLLTPSGYASLVSSAARPAGLACREAKACTLKCVRYAQVLHRIATTRRQGYRPKPYI